MFKMKIKGIHLSSSYFFSAAREENPYNRIKEIVKWYLSGFYKKPKVWVFFIIVLFQSHSHLSSFV